MNIKSTEKIYQIHRKSKVKKWFTYTLLGILLILFLPWTQNIKTKGNVSTLYQEQRPQKLNSPIPGKIIKWYVKNGDQVKKGDTILQIAEIKEDYLDPYFLERTQQQMNAKKGAIDYYSSKIITTENQLKALDNATTLKLKQVKIKIAQLQNKITAEEAELLAANNELKIAQDQLNRQNKMYEEGLVSLTQLQQRNVSFQSILAKKTAAENKLAQTQQEITSQNIELNAVLQEFAEKSSKIEGDRFQNLGQVANGNGEVAKLENLVATYTVRKGLYYILASQDGQIIQLNKSGIGEIVKEGESIGTIVPEKVNYMVELYIKPVDLPLVQKDQNVVFTFDGYPAILFSGWPNSSYGTFNGRIIAVENSINENGLFKALAVENSTKKKWPPKIKIGTGAQGIIILKDVPIWYEIWRNINGFPPDYYVINAQSNEKK